MVMAFIDLFKNTQNDEVEEKLRGEIMKKLLAKYGRHFWIVSLSVTFYASCDFAYNEGDFFSILMLAVLTYVFFIERNGKLEE
jgi:hypothetical protein